VQTPIFVVGARLSGTTLLRNMLNRHPAIAMCRETDFYHYVYKRRYGFRGLKHLRNRLRLVKQYLGTQRLRRMQLDLEALQERLLREGTSYPAFFGSLLRFYADKQEKKRCGEKTPEHALFTETLAIGIPMRASFILSGILGMWLASLQRLPSASNSAIGNARLWLSHNLGAWSSRHRPNYMLVRYEDLVTKAEDELRRLCAFLGEDYSAAMLTPNWDSTADRPWFRRAEEPVTTERIGRWREELTAEDVALTEWVLGCTIKMFGYSPVSNPPSRTALLRGLASAAYDAVWRRIAEFPGVWYSVTRFTRLAKEEAAKDRFRNRHAVGLMKT
jgi:hypothetical protein